MVRGSTLVSSSESVAVWEAEDEEKNVMKPAMGRTLHKKHVSNCCILTEEKC